MNERVNGVLDWSTLFSELVCFHGEPGTCLSALEIFPTLDEISWLLRRGLRWLVREEVDPSLGSYQHSDQNSSRKPHLRRLHSTNASYAEYRANEEMSGNSQDRK